MTNCGPSPAVARAAKPLVLYFGAFQRREFYDGLLRSHVHLGLLRNSDNTAYTAESPEFDLIERIRFSAGIEAICERLRRIARDWKLETILNYDETTVSLWAEACARIGLPALSPAAARAVRSKTLMRSLFLEHFGPYTGGRSVKVTTRAEAIKAAGTIGFPVIVKPSNLTGSFFVRRCDRVEQLTGALDELNRLLPEYCERNRITDVPPDILVEELLDGTNHSVECAVLDGRVWSTPVIDVVTGVEVGHNDYHHFARSTATALSPQEQREMRSVAERTAGALGVRRGCLHVELVQGPAGPRLIEVAGRPGTSRGVLLNRAFGLNLVAAYRDVMRGRTPDLVLRRNGAAAVLTPFPQVSGTLLGYFGLDRIRELRSVQRVDIYKRPGERVATRWSGAAFPVRVQMHSDDQARLAKEFRVVTEMCRTLFIVDPEPG